MTEQRSDYEQRDERGRLFSVVAEGRRFYYLDTLVDEVERLRAENERWRSLAFGGIDAAESEAYGAMERRYAETSNELDHALSELSSLRGVVQAAMAKLAEPDKWHRYEPRELGEAFLADVVLDCRDDVLAILAAAADAPQPPNAKVTPVTPNLSTAAVTHQSWCSLGRSPRGACDCRTAGPSPAVLPQPETEQR